MSADAAVPVFVTVQRESGAIEQVRVGYALRGPEGFVLHMGQLSFGSPPLPATSAAPSASGLAATTPGPLPFSVEPSRRAFSGLTADTSIEDLENLAARSRRTLGDPRKERWHAKERALLAAIEAELERKRTAAIAAG